METIKNYIIDVAAEEKSSGKETKIKKRPSVKYELKLSSGSDFVINRVTSKTDRDFVFIPSKNQIYIKDNKKEAIEACHMENVKRFFSDLTELEVGATSISKLNKSSLEIVFKAIEDEDFNKFLKKQYKIKDDDIICAYRIWLQSNKAFDEIFKMIGSYESFGGGIGEYYAHIRFFDSLLQYFGIDKARYIMQKIYLSPLYCKFISVYDENIIYANDTRNYLGFLFDIIKNWNYKTVIEYLYYELYRQGETNFLQSLILWRDTLQMEEAVYGKIKDKYPSNLRTYHNILTLKYGLIKEAYEKRTFCEAVNANDYKHLQYNGKEYSILIPEGPGDLADEGVNLSHCVKSYIKNVSNKTSKIVFMRKTLNPSESLITIEVIGNYINQVRGFSNRLANKKEMDFINEWAKEKKLNIAC